jgi:hypothetical protein
MRSESLRCPSATCTEGSELLGIIQEDGTTAYLSERVAVEKEFVRIASEGRSPEKRFRFSNQCVEAKCKQWTGTRCGVIDTVIRLLPDKVAESLPKCSIRATCRWFSQAGVSACSVCPVVVMDLNQKKKLGSET